MCVVYVWQGWFEFSFLCCVCACSIPQHKAYAQHHCWRHVRVFECVVCTLTVPQFSSNFEYLLCFCSRSILHCFVFLGWAYCSGVSVLQWFFLWLVSVPRAPFPLHLNRLWASVIGSVNELAGITRIMLQGLETEIRAAHAWRFRRPVCRVPAACWPSWSSWSRWACGTANNPFVSSFSLVVVVVVVIGRWMPGPVNTMRFDARTPRNNSLRNHHKINNKQNKAI